LVSGTVGAIDHDLQTVEAQTAGKTSALTKFDIAPFGVVEPAGTSQPVARRERSGRIDIALDLGFDVVGKLVAVRTEELDAVVDIGIVRRGNHHPEIGAQRARQHGDRRGPASVPVSTTSMPTEMKPAVSAGSSR